jgi:hypothetical protein
MGHLESELESWKQAEQNLESQVSRQSQTVEALRLQEALAVHDEQVAAVVWWDCKMLMCCMIVAGLAVCYYATGLQTCPKSSYNAVHEAPQPARRVRAQPEFIEKNAQQEVEDTLQVTLLPSVPSPKPAAIIKNLDLEAVQVPDAASEVKHEQISTAQQMRMKMEARRSIVEAETASPRILLDEKVEEVKLHSNGENGKDEEATLAPRRKSTCQFYSLDEDVPVAAEEDWWNESTSGY